MGLAGISTAYVSDDELKKGDILLNAGHHVRLFYKRHPDTHAIVVIEASGNGWKAAIHTLKANDLHGYIPRYYHLIQQ